ncbi:MAG TPA: hypothetical protein VM598_07260, partial [Bdellovibrionota bacterium]|nr:hypothetical protein [Bdellovibrionota bacterium]
YASIWFELRRAAGSAGAGQIDTLFTEHLRTLASTDTFESAGSKMIAADNTLFGGSHAAAIRAEFTRRGLTVP